MDPCDPLHRLKTDGVRGHSSFNVKKKLVQKIEKELLWLKH